MPTRRTTLRPNLTSVAFAEESRATNDRRGCSQVSVDSTASQYCPRRLGSNRPGPLTYLFRCWFPFFHSKSRSGTVEIQTASRSRQSVSRLEIRRLVRSFCTAGTGPLRTLGLRYGGKEAAENCWVALHVPTLHVQHHHTLLFSATPCSKRRRTSPTESRLDCIGRTARQRAPADFLGPRRSTRWHRQ
jgi:hypothetical protein